MAIDEKIYHHDASTDIFVDTFGQATPAPTSYLAKCGHSY